MFRASLSDTTKWRVVGVEVCQLVSAAVRVTVLHLFGVRSKCRTEVPTRTSTFSSVLNSSNAAGCLLCMTRTSATNDGACGALSLSRGICNTLLFVFHNRVR